MSKAIEVQSYKSMAEKTPIDFEHDRKALFEFIVPMMPQSWLDKGTWNAYLEDINTGKQPTAFAISILDTKQPANWKGEPFITEHWRLAHFLLDGHHKIYAASLLNKPIRLLSFSAVDESVAEISEINQAIRILQHV